MKKEVEKKKFSLTPFSIILILLALLALITHFLPSADFEKNGELGSGSGVVAASLSDFLIVHATPTKVIRPPYKAAMIVRIIVCSSFSGIR